MKRNLVALFLMFLICHIYAQIPSRIVMGGRAVLMVGNIVYAFPEARSRVIAIAGTDQGLGTFLETWVPNFKQIQSFDRNAGVEAYASFRPDLVILKDSLKTGIGAQLEQLGIKTAYLNLESPEAFYTDLMLLGRLFYSGSRAFELIMYYNNITNKAASAAAGKTKPKVLLLQQTRDGFEVPPDSWMQTRLVEMAGGLAVWKNNSGGWLRINAEQIAAWNPDVLIIVSYREHSSRAAAAILSDPRFASLNAVKNRKVAGFPQDFSSWDQSDTRWGMGLLWLSNLLYPNPGYSAESEARIFYKLFYGFTDAQINSEIIPRIHGIKQ
jgi:iron complex transport system substrate-binding protein